MKVCIYGLGAIGGLVGARLARSGQPVSAVARGATLEAVRREGLVLVEGAPGDERRTTAPIHASDDPADLGEQDVVILAVKTTALMQVADAIAPLLGPDTSVLSAMNGLQWWFLHGLDDTPTGLHLETVDPGARITAAIDPARVVGCVTHLAASTPQPGVVRHTMGDRLIIGEPAGGTSTRAQAIAAMLSRASFTIDTSDQIQRDVWFKLWGNMTINPISAMTGATADRILDDDFVRAFLSSCMLEASAIGERIGLPAPGSPQARHDVTRKLGAFRSSMLQDVDAGRPVELDALVAAVAELGGAVGVPTPRIESLLGLARLHARVRGLYPS